MAKNKESAGAGRTRNYSSVVYPDSAPDNWLHILGEECVPCFVSPLHDKDINADNTPKKPHYHVMLMFDGVKTPEQAREVFERIGGVGCEPIKSVRAYARYLCHLDNPDKAQYDIADVVQYGGADYHDIIGLAIDKYVAIGEIIDFCESNDIHSYAKLLVWCRENRFEWFRVLCDSATLVIKEYLKSRTWTLKNEEKEED